MEVDGGHEVVVVAEASSRVLHPLDLRVDRFAGGVGHPVPEVGQDLRVVLLEGSAPLSPNPFALTNQ